MWRTTAQLTCRQRRRPPPTPSTDDATTCVVETGAPTNDAPRITPAEAAWLATASIGWMRKIRRPTVLMMPPAAQRRCQPSAPARRRWAPSAGDAALSDRPSATHSAAMMPTDFCASLAPWLNASAADSAHSPLSSARARRRVARRPAPRARGSTSSATPAPSTGETANATSVPTHADGCPSCTPPHWMALVPLAASAAPTSPPTSAWPELDGSPSAQVTAFHATAASSPAPMTSTPDAPADGDDPADRVGDRGADDERPSRLKQRPSARRRSGRAARVATSAAIALDASCTPLVTANTTARPNATANPTRSRRRR